MSLHQLPSRIVQLMIGTILIFVLTLGVSIFWMSRALDDQAHQQSLTQVRIARDNLLSQVRLTTLDYTKWETAVDALEAGDLDWVYENIGAAATVGQVVQLVVAWGGNLAEDLGWTDDGVEVGRSGLLEPSVIALAERHLADMPLGTYEGAEFFIWHEGSVFAFAAARFEVVGDERNLGARDEDIVRLTMGRRVSEEVIAAIAESTLLSGLAIVPEMPSDRAFVRLLGGNGEPVAYLAWDSPRPGTILLQRMLPFLLAVVVFAAGLALRGMRLVRHNAEYLVAAERQASTVARTDALTGLPNRTAFNEILLAPARANQRAMMFLDVNDFKRINDSIGHAAGDLVINYVAQRLAKLVSPGCLLARIGGDEFVFVVTGPDSETRVKRLAKDAESSVARPFDVLGHQMQLRMAMGYAVQLDDETTGDDLVRQADLAMYEAKRQKGAGPVAFNIMIEQASRDANVIEKGLKAALAKQHEIAIAYQPIVGADGHLVRAEALARWTSPELGQVPPDRFIAVAEQAGLIVELGRRLFQLVCDDLVAHPNLKVSVNISPLQLMAPDFIPAIVCELRGRGLDPARVEVELTESVIVDDSRLAAERLEELRAGGFTIALDDFGTGYSSMGYLWQFRFDTLKIDRSFVSRIRASAQGVAVVDGMIRMAHGLDLRVVCEGVETAEEIVTLRELGCDLVQGYYLDRPLPISAFAERWLAVTERRAKVA